MYFFGLAWLLGGLLCVSAQPAYAASLTQDSILNLVNRARTEHQLPALESNALLATAARSKLADMLARRYFAHQNPDGLMPWDFMEAAGYPYRYAGENLAVDYEEASAVVRDWLDSSAHRQNILNKNFQDTGIAVSSSSGHTYVVELFGSSTVTQKIHTPPAPMPESTQSQTSRNASIIITEDATPENQATPRPEITSLPPEKTTETSPSPTPLLIENDFTAFSPSWL